MTTAVDGTLDFPDTNSDLDYATHNYFRYFGKLPPTVVRHILQHGLRDSPGGPFLDLMCGCGTSLVESKILGIPSIGVDVNPLSALICKVKTTIVSPTVLKAESDRVLQAVLEDLTHVRAQPALPGLGDHGTHGAIDTDAPQFHNRDYWFAPAVRAELAAIRGQVERVEIADVRDFLRVAFLSIVRRVSNASPRAGRIFHIGHDRQVDVVAVFAKKCLTMIDGMQEMTARARNVGTGIITADARATGLPEDCFGFVLNHPPYFALYKYSSDVLRFELEWARYDRRQISRNEIRDGFKTTRLDALDEYVADMADVFAEAHRVLRPGGSLCLVVNNSTLGDVRLPVVERLTRRAQSAGFSLRRHFDRVVRYSQASYHRSARADKRVNRDHILFFLK